MPRDTLSMTPPLTPIENDLEQLEELDYRDFINLNNDTTLQGENGVLLFGTISNPSTTANDGSSLLFNCRGECHPEDVIGKNSYLGSSALRNLLYIGKPFLSLNYNPKLTLQLDILSLKLSHCFMKIRKTIQKLERSSKPFCSGRIDLGIGKSSPFELRKEVVDTLHGVSLYLSDLALEEREEFIPALIDEIIEMLKFLGPIYLLPSHVANASSPLGNKCSSAAFHLLHLHLDVRWWFLTLLHQIEFILGKEVEFTALSSLNINTDFVKELKLSSVPGDNTQCSFFDSFICLLIWDILTLMKKQVSKGSVSEVFFIPPFSCTCSFELAVSVFHITEWRHKFKMKKVFWSLVTEKLSLLLKFTADNINDDFWTRQSVNDFSFPSITFKDLKSFQIWWIFTNIAKIFQYDSEGTKLNQGSTEIEMLRKLITQTITNSGKNNSSEEELRLYLRCCHSLLNLWKVDKEVKQSSWVVILWDYFSKVMDCNFMIRGATLEEFANQSETPSAFLELIKLLTESPLINKNESSWMIFLRVIIGLVKHSDHEWRYLKGRIFSKFHSKKMAELSPTGIYNTSLLFLSLANSADLNLCIKLCDLLCNSTSDGVKKLHTVCLSLAAVAYFLISKSCRLDDVADKIERKISSIHQKCSSSIDVYERREVGHSVVILCNGLQEVLQISTDLTLGQNKLFSVALSSYTSQASTVEQKSILSCLELGLKKVCKATQDLHYLANGIGLDILESIWGNFHIFIKEQLRSMTPHSSLGTICSLLVVCSSRLYSSPTSNSNIQGATTLLSYIIDENLIANRMKMLFLKSLLQEQGSVEYLSKIYENYDEKMINCLFLSLVLDGDTEEITAATEVIFATSKLVKIVPEAPPCPFGALEMLIQCLAKQFKEAEIFQTRLKIREKSFSYISSLDKSLISLMKKTPLPSHLPQVFRIIGCIFSHSSSLFYIKGKNNCPLPNLISAVVLPNSVYNAEKSLGPSMLEVLLSLLPKVMLSLASLGPTSDSYVSRCLKDIFINYIYRFPSTTHPFMEVLSSDETPNIKEVKTLFIETVHMNFFSKRNCSLVHLQLVISLLLELLRKYLNHWLEIVCSIIFPPLLELLLYLDDLQTKRLASDLLRKLLQASEVRKLSSLVEDVRKFVSCHLAWHSSRVFRILDVIAVMNCNIIKEALPGIEDAIKRTEDKRGSGEDQTLRKGYKALLNRINDVNETHTF